MYAEVFMFEISEQRPAASSSAIVYAIGSMRPLPVSGGSFDMSLHQQQPICASAVTIREFQPGDEAAFRKLNEEWITHYFRIEAKEAEVMADPKGTILDPGGRIFFATVQEREKKKEEHQEKDRCIGCCALRRLGDAEFEVAKMAVTPEFQGAGIGRKILEAVIDAARAMGARRLYLETNHTLTPAIRLYESVGFRHIPPERIVPSVYVRADVYMELIF
jgi:putative acetyltransferase